MNFFEKSKWISNKVMSGMAADINARSLILRKTFDCENLIEKATIYCCGLGQAVYHINGENITDEVFVTHFTKYDSRVLYNIFDVTAFIREGKNAIVVHLGNWFYNDCNTHWNRSSETWRAQPKLLLALVLNYADGKTQIINSDTTWKICGGPVIYNNVQSGEIYDARLDIKDWDNVFCRDENWDNALICMPPGGVLEHTEMPPIKVVRKIIPEYIGNGIYDCKEGISGRAAITVSGNSGDEIELKYIEYIDENGNIDEHINTCLDDSVLLKHTDKYILSGADNEKYFPDFVYHGFRYVKVSNETVLKEIEFEVIHNDFDIIGEFSCSDSVINEIHDAARRSTLTNYIDIPLDCPHREQNGWTGDALISCQQSLMNFEIKDAYKKWMNDFKDAQRPSGQLPAVIPSSNWGYNWGAGPAWDSTIIMIPYYTYQNTGDKSLIVQMWENMKLYMKYMQLMSQDYIVDYGLGDWKPPYYVIKCPTCVTDTGYFYANSVIMAKCCAIMGEEDIYTDLSLRIKESYRSHFMNDEELLKIQTFIACGIYWGLYNDDEVPVMAEKLNRLVAENDYHIDCGILGTKYIFSALSENGYASTAYKMVTNPTPPSYAYWINLGLKNLCEQWFLKKANGETESLNHHMFSEVEYWFYKYLAGINVDENGVTIKPCFIPELDWVKATHRDISVFWDKEKITIKTGRKVTLVLLGKETQLEKGEYEFNL